MKIKLIPNPNKQWAEGLVKEAKSFLLGLGYEIVETKADISICIGGDGTIFHANYDNLIEGPIIGIGSKTSYICQLMHTSWKNELKELIENGKKVSLMTLCAQIGDQSFNAINDFVVHASDYRVLKISIGNGVNEQSFYGDGIIASTSLGSAAYAHSAGGEILSPTERKISVVPICPYRRKYSPHILDEDAEIVLSTDNECAFIVDGIFGRKIEKEEQIIIKKGRDTTFFEGVGHYK